MSNGQASNYIQLSEKAQISLVTCGSGEDLYALFGHSAVRVYDPERKFDIVYNYGVFDFDTPNFYLKFTAGKLPYKVAPNHYSRFVKAYIRRDRSVSEQELNLSQEEKQAVFEYLENNLKPENRYYQYDFFFDNCATKIRDIFQDVLGDKLKFYEDPADEGKTFRNLIDEYLIYSPWADFGIDLALGSKTDDIVQLDDFMFLPEYMEKAFGMATLSNDENGTIPFVKSKKVLYEASPLKKPTGIIAYPFRLIGLLCLVLVSIEALLFKKGSQRYILEGTLFLVIGIVGLILTLLWFATDHNITVTNWNLLWANPLYLLAAFWAFKGKSKPKFFAGLAVSEALVLISFIFLPQALHIACIPIIILLAVCNLRIAYQGQRLR